MNGLEALSFLAERGVTVTMVNSDTFDVGEFYESDIVRVNLKANAFIARNDEVTEVPEDSSLVQQLLWANEDWQQRSKHLSAKWKELHPAWSLVQRDLRAIGMG
jgi:hypothetical protein